MFVGDKKEDLHPGQNFNWEMIVMSVKFFCYHLIRYKCVLVSSSQIQGDVN